MTNQRSRRPDPDSKVEREVVRHCQKLGAGLQKKHRKPTRHGGDDANSNDPSVGVRAKIDPAVI
jgi:hypothetical protein